MIKMPLLFRVNSYGRARWGSGTALLLILTMLAGCEDKRRHQASEDVEFPDVPPPVSADASAETTALALLDAIRTLQSIRAVGFGVEGNKKKYDHAMGLVASLIDKEHVFQTVKGTQSPSIPRDISRDAAVRLIIDSWTSMTAHYIEGIDAGTASAILFQGDRESTAGTAPANTSGAAKSGEAMVRVEAENPQERELLKKIEASDEVRNLKTTDGKPVTPGSEVYVAKVREIALRSGVNVPIRARISVSLRKMPEGWRAVQLKLEGTALRTATQPVGAS